jgi:NAD(P)H-hydrate epimerase
MSGWPVVTPDEMAILEQKNFSGSFNPEAAMERVARKVADEILQAGFERAIFLIGRGNNGGDGARAAQLLLESGIVVEVFYIEGEGSPLQKKHLEAFIGSKYPMSKFDIDTERQPGTLFVDALFGTGFKGPLPEEITALIESLNRVSACIWSIDIPSGLDGESGEPQPVCLRAQSTLYCALPKKGFFLRSGFAYTGRLIHISLGIDFNHQSAWRMLDLNDLKMPSIDPLRHKFETGVVGGVIASREMAGAGALAARSAFRAGSGYVRLALFAQGIDSLLPLESVKEVMKDPAQVADLLNQCDGAWIGPGLPENELGRALVKTVLAEAKIPLVLDGGALYHLSQMRACQLPPKTILTPHRGEMYRLDSRMGSGPLTPTHIETARSFAERRGVTLVLKGAPTWIFHPGEPVLISPFGDPGMATAGSGDVLSGIIAALLAAGLEPREAAALGVGLHGISGELASRELTSYSLLARDLIHYLPQAIAYVLENQSN